MSVHVVHICGKFSESPMKAPCLTWSCALSRAHRARPVRSGAALREQAEGAVLARTWPKPPQLNGAAVVRKSSSCRQTGSSCSSFVARTSSLSSSTGAAAAAARKAKLADVAALVLEVPLRFGMDFQRSALPPATQGPRTTIVGDEIACTERSSRRAARLASENCTAATTDAGRFWRARAQRGGANGSRDGRRDAWRPSGAPWGSARRVRRPLLRKANTRGGAGGRWARDFDPPEAF